MNSTCNFSQGQELLHSSLFGSLDQASKPNIKIEPPRKDADYNATLEHFAFFRIERF